MIDPVVYRLLEKAIDSPVKLHLLLIFHENQRMEATARSIAERVCRDIWSVSQALQELAEDGVMSCKLAVNGETIYHYQPVLTMIEPIERLIRGYDDPIERDQLQRTIRNLVDFAAFRRSASPVSTSQVA
jgi:transcription initiation factor IIE alpha subunit